MRLENANCIDILKSLPDNSIDSVITDPPYGLEFDEDERIYNDVWSTGKVIKNGPAFRRVPLEDKVKFQKLMYEWSRDALRVTKPGGTLLCFGHPKMFHWLVCGLEEAGWQIKETIMWLYGTGYPKSVNLEKQSDDAKWTGYKSHALKPVYEPITMAMKENEGTYIENAEKYGIAGLNIDACVGSDGKFPSNLIVGKDMASLWDIRDRFFFTPKPDNEERDAGCEGMPSKNFHPTVKPLSLMEYLCKLTSPPGGGIVLDPFMGSGTAGVACVNTNRDFIGIEKNSDYFKIAEYRISDALAKHKSQRNLFSF